MIISSVDDLPRAQEGAPPLAKEAGHMSAGPPSNYQPQRSIDSGDGPRRVSYPSPYLPGGRGEIGYRSDYDHKGDFDRSYVDPPRRIYQQRDRSRDRGHRGPYSSYEDPQSPPSA